jgi:hypothetical protein
MRAQVPYLARLARHSTGQEALRPPRQLFPGGTYSPARRPGTDESAWHQDSGAGALTFPAGRPDGPVAAPPAAAPAGPTVVPPPQGGAPSATHRAEAQPPRSWPEPLWGTPVDLPRTAGLPLVPGETDGGTTARVDTGGRVASGGRSGRSPAPAATPDRRDAVVPLSQGGAPSATHRAEAQPPRSWPEPLWGTPVDLPRTAGLQHVPGETDDGGAFGPELQSTALTPRPGTGRPAGPGRGHDDRGRDDRGQDSGDAGIRVTPNARAVAAPERPPAPAAAGADRSPAPMTARLDRLQAPAVARDLVPAAPRDLMPPPAAVPRPAAAGTEPAGRLRDPRPSGQARVSIGTIEVTVVPAAPPTPEIGRNQPSAPAAPGRSRPASPLAAGMTAGRLEQGLRRWHGIAQG